MKRSDYNCRFYYVFFISQIEQCQEGFYYIKIIRIKRKVTLCFFNSTADSSSLLAVFYFCSTMQSCVLHGTVPRQFCAMSWTMLWCIVLCFSIFLFFFFFGFVVCWRLCTHFYFSLPYLYLSSFFFLSVFLYRFIIFTTTLVFHVFNAPPFRSVSPFLFFFLLL